MLIFIETFCARISNTHITAEGPPALRDYVDVSSDIPAFVII